MTLEGLLPYSQADHKLATMCFNMVPVFPGCRLSYILILLPAHGFS